MEIGVEGRNRLGSAARRRIEQHYTLRGMMARYATLYDECSFQSRSKRIV